MYRKNSIAFTLIELLIVVAIIGILAAIAVPNFLNAQLKARIARVESEFNSISTAFRMYLLDSNGSLPRWTSLGWHEAWGRFTTPIAYMTVLPLDLFQPKPGVGEQVHDHLWYEYSGCLGKMPMSMPMIAGKVDNFVLASIGPDADDDTDLIQDYPRASKFMPFDLTNGMRSDGDIIYETAAGLNPTRG
ncbi:MAG: prepilin-type N-terminal cleavage/methylation domain-containing protein [bacterium]